MDPLGMSWMALTMVIAAVAAAAVVAVIAVAAIRAARRPEGELDSARGLLERRLAAGEIDADEYYEREAALRSGQPSGLRSPRRRGGT